MRYVNEEKGNLNKAEAEESRREREREELELVYRFFSGRRCRCSHNVTNWQ